MATAEAPEDFSDDLGARMHEFMGLGVGSVVDGLVTGVIKAGAATPLVAPLIVMLKQAKDLVDKAARHKEELEKLLEFCGVATAQVIDTYNDSLECFDITPLEKCIEELREVSGDCDGKSGAISELRGLNDDDRIEKLGERLGAHVSITALGARRQHSNQLVSVPRMLAAVYTYRPDLEGLVA